MNAQGKIRNEGRADNRPRSNILGRRPTVKYALVVLAIMMAAFAAAQLVPGGTEESSADAYTIDLGVSTSVTGAVWSGDTLTFSTAANNHTYTFTGSRASLSVVFPAGVTTTVTMNGVTVSTSGTITLNGTANVTLLLEGTNKITGNVIVPSTASLTIDSATVPGSSDGSLTVTPNGTASNSVSAWIAGIGGQGTNATNGANRNAGAITINGGTVVSSGGYAAAGIGGSHWGAGGTISITGGTVIATGNTQGAGIGGGRAGAGGTASISGGTVTAVGGNSTSGGAGIGGGNGAAGSTLVISSDADVKAYANGSLPAIHAASVASESTGYYANAHFAAAVSTTSATAMNIYGNNDVSSSVDTVELPA
ncbi:MAG: hypothetical protein LBG63_03995, partial [Candidatus Methanoplasma sp.]|nr:hypothetical protein [Candidatus Methanoplasma sp.]